MSGAVGVARADLPTDLPHCADNRAHAERSRADPRTKWDYAAPRSETQVGTTGSRVGRARAVSSARRGASTRSQRRARPPSSRPSATAARAECGRAEVRSCRRTAADRAARDILFRRRASGRQRGWGGAVPVWRALVRATAEVRLGLQRTPLDAAAALDRTAARRCLPRDCRGIAADS